MEDREERRRETETGWTIIKQMGGPRLIQFMTGATITVGELPWRSGVRAGAEIALPFQAHEDIDRVVITYDEGRDLYGMQGFAGTEEKRCFEQVYNDQLMDLFEEMTLVYLTLTPRRPMTWGGLLPESEVEEYFASQEKSSRNDADGDSGEGESGIEESDGNPEETASNPGESGCSSGKSEGTSEERDSNPEEKEDDSEETDHTGGETDHTAGETDSP